MDHCVFWPGTLNTQILTSDHGLMGYNEMVKSVKIGNGILINALGLKTSISNYKSQ